MKKAEYLFIRHLVKTFVGKNLLLLNYCEPMKNGGLRVNLSEMFGKLYLEGAIKTAILQLSASIHTANSRAFEIFDIQIYRDIQNMRDVLEVKVLPQYKDEEAVKGLMRIYNLL